MKIYPHFFQFRLAKLILYKTCTFIQPILLMVFICPFRNSFCKIKQVKIRISHRLRKSVLSNRNIIYATNIGLNLLVALFLKK